MLLFIGLLLFISNVHAKIDDQLVIITVATSKTDGYLRFMDSAKQNNLTVEVLGLGQEWLGGNIKYNPGGGHKVNLLKDALLKYKDIENQVIMFTDSYDVILIGDEKTILDRFHKSNSKVLFSAESFCWPDSTLEKSYPDVFVGKRFLNSGGFIGYASSLLEIVNQRQIDNSDDDQLYYTQIYLKESLRKHLNIKLDHKSSLFQNLNGIQANELQLKFDEKSGQAFVFNSIYNTKPLVLHGNGPSKVTLNSLGNYLANSWSPTNGCNSCKLNRTSLDDKKLKDYPTVLIGVFIHHATPFLDEFFIDLENLRYPKDKLSILIHNSVEYHDKSVQRWVDNNQLHYSMLSILPKQSDEWIIRTYLIEKCLEFNCDYYLSLDSDARLTNETSLQHLIEQNRNIIAPLLSIPDKLWSNFWGSLSGEGYYARSHDYVDILKGTRRGLWNVPYISQAYLMKGSFLKDLMEKRTLSNEVTHTIEQQLFKSHSHEQDTDMSFSKFMRDNGIFMYVSNEIDFGHLVNSESYTTDHLHNDLYEIYTNKLDWERKYIHPNYSQALNEQEFNLIQQRCPDVYNFPLVSETFCYHLIEEMENYGKWSEGKNQDKRLQGGYENVPTVDIHMNQIGFEQHWLYFLRQYITPIQEKIFVGYYHDPPKAIMNFVVRYHPNEQAFLRPHHDSSTYTINIALNRAGIDYEGGGCRFERYNCSLVDLPMGWSLIHPGRLTHYHEGLRVTKGVRYIMVSFVDP